MTNRELLAAAREGLSAADRQRQHVLRVELTAMACPACLTPLDAIRAAGIDVDDYRFGQVRHQYQCPDCGAELEQVVPVFAAGPAWHWQLRHGWLAERLQKARLYDRLKEKSSGA
jgi:uncharacterized protein (UPF0212 family)